MWKVRKMSRLISWFLEWKLEGSRYQPFTVIRSIARLGLVENALCSDPRDQSTRKMS